MALNYSPKKGDLRIWWIQTTPGRQFHRDVSNVAEAALLMDALEDYDIFHLGDQVSPGCNNAGGLSVFKDGKWKEWHHPDTGDNLHKHMQALAKAQEAPEASFKSMARVVNTLLPRSPWPP